MGPESPIAPDELHPSFDRLLAGPLALAVSAGCDSVALMHLVADWLRSRRAADRAPATPIVLTVDHGLRPESAGEAAWVEREAAKIGFAHATLKWMGPRPQSGVQSTARAARYRLMDEFLETEVREARVARKRSIVTAHHADDQAETFLMRLARGSGLDGLSAMRETEHMRAPLADGAAGGSFTILRPLLQVPKARLAATLAARGIGWREDPSNRDPDFERVRVREALRSLEGLGIGSTQLARSAGRLARARAAVAAGLAEVAPGLVDLHGGLLAEIDASLLMQVAEEYKLRILAALVEAYGGASPPAQLSQMEVLAADMTRLDSGERVVRTLGGCRIERRMGGPIRIWRELGREGLEELDLQAGESLLWDRRFVVRLAEQGPRAVRVKALGSGDRPELERALALAGAKGGRPPLVALATLPSFWRDAQLVAVPNIAALRDAAGHCSAEFAAGTALWDRPGATVARTQG